MKQVVHVHHPAPVRYVPKGGSVERLGFAKAVTPVRLRQVASKELRRVATIRTRDHNLVDRDLFAFEGRLWAPLRQWGRRWSVVDPGEFVHQLECDLVDRSMHSDVERDLQRTPLCSMYQRERSRGLQDFGPGTVRRIVHDGTERAKADLARFVEQEIVVTSRATYVRHPGPLAFVTPGGYCDYMLADQPRSHMESFLLGGRVGRLEEFSRFLAGQPQYHVPSAERTALLEGGGLSLLCGRSGIPERLLGDDDVHLFMQQAPEAVLATYLPDLRRDEAGDAAAKARLGAMLDRMLAWRALGCVGAIRPDEAEACLSDVRDFLRDAFVAFPFHRAAGLAGLRLDYVEQVALPRISRPEPEAAPDDEAALAAMPML